MLHSKLQSYTNKTLFTLLTTGLFFTQACKEVTQVDSVTKNEVQVEASIDAEDFYNLNNEYMTETFESLVQNGAAIDQAIKGPILMKSSAETD